jgi:hypothetical protein
MQEQDPYEGSAQWLREVSRRKAPSRPAIPDALVPPAPTQSPKRPASHVRGLMLSGALSVAFLQYYFLDVMVQIGTLPEIVIFVNAPPAA